MFKTPDLSQTVMSVENIPYSAKNPVKAISKGLFRHCEFLFLKNKQKKMMKTSDRQSIISG
jgi:hypothetical protein